MRNWPAERRFMKTNKTEITAWLVCAGLIAAVGPGSAQTNAETTTTVASAEKSFPKIQFAGTEFDFGKLKAGESVKHNFIFTNTGTAVLEITDVRPSCGCTTAGGYDRQVAPGKTGSIPLQFNSTGFNGELAKVVNVSCNDPTQSNVMLRIKGVVWKPIEVTPGTVVFNIKSESETQETRTARIVSNLEKPVDLSEPECTNRAFRAELKTLQAGKEFELLLTAVPPFDSSPLIAVVTLKTSAPEMPVIPVGAYLVVQHAVTVSPEQIRVPAGPLAGGMSLTVTVRNNRTNALALSDASINLPGGTVRLQELQPGKLFSLVVGLPTGFQVKPEAPVEVSVKSNHAKYPVIKVPVLGPLPSRLPPAIGR